MSTSARKKLEPKFEGFDAEQIQQAANQARSRFLEMLLAPTREAIPRAHRNKRSAEEIQALRDAHAKAAEAARAAWEALIKGVES